jgi:transposase
MAIADGHGLPFAVHVASASPHETKLVEPTLEQRFLRETPERMIGDRAYDSDPLDQRIQQRYGVQLIAPHKFVRVATATQDGRRLRRYRRRWKIERLFAWLHKKISGRQLSRMMQMPSGNFWPTIGLSSTPMEA